MNQTLVKFHKFNHNQCKIDQFNTHQTVIIKESKSKKDFWSNHVNQHNITAIENKFNTKFDFIWLIDNDMLLETFNFDAFITMSYRSSFDHLITQPAIIPRYEGGRSTDWEILRQQTNLAAHSSGIIEIMVPMFAMKTWKIIQPLMKEQYMSLGGDLQSDWGPDLWWCQYVSRELNDGEGGCVVVDYTPLVHINLGTQKKSKKFLSDSWEMLKRIRKDISLRLVCRPNFLIRS